MLIIEQLSEADIRNIDFSQSESYAAIMQSTQ